MDLAMKRHNIMREAYQDATSLMQSNMAAGQAKLQIAAAKFGDQKMLYLLEHGMSKEIFELQDARNRAMLGTMEAAEKFDEHHIRAKMYQDAITASQNLPEQQRTQFLNSQFQNIFKPNMKSPEEAMAYTDLFNKAAQEKRLPSIEEMAAVHQKFAIRYGTGGAGVPTNDRQINADAARYEVRLREEHPEMSDDDIAKKRAEKVAELRSLSTPPSANRRDELQGKIDRVTFGEELIDKIDKLLLMHRAISGLGGEATRPLEVISNILGSDATDRKEFQRLVSEMQMIAPRLLLDTNGRPLGQEAGRLNTEIAGLSAGDTGANTLRAYFELRDQLKGIKQRLQERKGDKPSAKGGDAGGNWWESPDAGRVK